MHRGWIDKFRHAFRGLAAGLYKQYSFLVHLPAAALVLILAAGLRVESWEWCVLILCITIVIAAELFNTSIEILLRRLHPDRHAEVGRALDVSAAAVLVTAIGAAAVGAIVLGGALLREPLPAPEPTALAAGLEDETPGVSGPKLAPTTQEAGEQRVF